MVERVIFSVKMEIIQGRCVFTRFSGLLCTIMGVLVVLLNCAMPEKMKEVFGVGGMDDEDASSDQSYLNSVFLDDLTVSPFAPKARLVSCE